MKIKKNRPALILAAIGLIMLITSCPSEPESLGPVSPGGIANASENAKRLYNYLTDEYGKHIISGQMDTSWTTNKGGNNPIDMIARVYDDTGKYPAIKGFDLIQINAWNGSDNGKEQTDEAIEWWNGTNNGQPLVAGKHGIVAFCWHWHPGVGQNFYTNVGSHADDGTAFRIPMKDGALDTTSTDGKQITADLDKAAIQLKRLQAEGIPVLWRPLHEAYGNKDAWGGGWFWWGATRTDGVDRALAYKALWAYMYDYLTREKKLDNLIWVWNGQHKDWFPDDPATVDIVGTDVYPPAKDYGSQSGKFAETALMVPGGSTRIVALTENGEIPDPDNCKKDEAMWSWFMTWNDGAAAGTNSNNFWSGEAHNTGDHKNKVYKHDLVITLDELPDLTSYRLD